MILSLDEVREKINFLLTPCVNIINGTTYRQETLPDDLDGLKLETIDFEYTLDMQLACIQTPGIREWMGFLWEFEIFPKMSMNKVDLYGANLQEVNLVKVDLYGANLQGVNLYKSYLLDNNMQGANLQGANLQESFICEVNLQGANLEGANLEGANFHKVNLKGANLKGANLKGAILFRIIYDSSTVFPDEFDPEEILY